MSSTSSDFVVPPSVLVRQVDGEMVLLDLRSERYYGLDAVGAAMVAALLEHPRERAIEALLAVFTINRERLVGDLDALVDRLTGAGLLVATSRS